MCWWLELGYSSLFYFLHPGARRWGLCITSVVEVVKVLTAENRHGVLPKFFQRSKRAAMALAAALQPSAAPHRRRDHCGTLYGDAAVGAAARHRAGRSSTG